MIGHVLGSRKERHARRIAHYERYLSEATSAFAAYDAFLDSVERENRASEEYELLREELAEAFGPEVAEQAMAVFNAKDGGIDYQAIVAKMKAHIASLKQRAGHPPRLEP